MGKVFFKDKYIKSEVVGVSVSIISLLWVWLFSRSDSLSDLFFDSFLLFSLAGFFIVVSTGFGLSIFLVDAFGKSSVGRDNFLNGDNNAKK